MKQSLTVYTSDKDRNQEEFKSGGKGRKMYLVRLLLLSSNKKLKWMGEHQIKICSYSYSLSLIHWTKILSHMKSGRTWDPCEGSGASHGSFGMLEALWIIARNNRVSNPSAAHYGGFTSPVSTAGWEPENPRTERWGQRELENVGL